MKKIVVAIDGPAGAGKSTIAKLAAEKLGYAYIDTGAMYRSVAWKFLQTGKPFDEDFISGLSKTMLIDFKPEAKINRVFVDGTEVTDAIRTPEVTAIVSRVAAIGAVREAMVDQQRRMGEAGGVLMDGRDIGTVVFPDAELKLFVTASPEVRAKRRVDELEAKGIPASYEEVLENVKKRDYIDSTREESPLRQADDALVLDNSHMTLEEQKAWLLEQYNKAIGLSYADIGRHIQ